MNELVYRAENKQYVLLWSALSFDFLLGSEVFALYLCSVNLAFVNGVTLAGGRRRRRQQRGAVQDL